MIPFFLYLAEASIILALFYLIYWAFIKGDTFHGLKRFYLLASLTLAHLIPQLPSVNWTKDIVKTSIPRGIINIPDVNSHNNFERLVFGKREYQPASNSEVKHTFTPFVIIVLIYIMGVGFMCYHLLNNLVRILILARSNGRELHGKYSIVTLKDDYPTFSFFNISYLNEKNLDKEEKDKVLFHEETHITQLHSLDILYLEICRILFWFNPVIWLYKKSLLKVHECLADEAVLVSKAGSVLNYQSLLLKQYLSNVNIELAHPFNYSLIKFRIDMMTKTKSKWWAKYKLLFALPVIILCLVGFTNYHENLSKTKLYYSGNSQYPTEPKGWTFSNVIHFDSYKISSARVIVKHGQKSALIESLDHQTNDESILLQHFIKNEFKGRRVKMTGFIKSQGISDSAMMWLRVDDIDKKMSTDFDNMWDRPITGTRDWTKCEIVFDAPERSAIFFGFIIRGVGKIWIDNVSFEIVNKSVSKTTYNLNSPLPEIADEQIKNCPKNTDLPETPPLNLDFEE